jgi:hypothetical protein
MYTIHGYYNNSVLNSYQLIFNFHLKDRYNDTLKGRKF